VIPTKNRYLDLKRCLHSLRNQTFKDFDIIVVDNGSVDMTANVLKEFKIQSVYDPSDDLAHILNVGWRLAKSDIIAFLNDDTWVTKKWAETLVEFLSANDQVKAIGGPTIDVPPKRMVDLFARSDSIPLLKLAFRLYNVVIMKGKFFDIGDFDEWAGSSVGGTLPSSMHIKGIKYTNGLSVTNVAIKRETLEYLKGFDESFKYIHADGDLFIRMRKRGVKMVFHPQVIAYHFWNPRGSTRSYYFLGRDTVIFWLKHARNPEAVLRSLLHCLFITCYVTFFCRANKNLVPLANWCRGLLNGTRYYFQFHKCMLR
jgi:GT2 family glycosyltransferase